MKIRLFLVLSILLGLSGYAYAQTQQGYVKTKGRMMNGKYYAGKRISDATVQVKDRSAVRSRADGSFSFPVPGKSYSLQQVQKQGFVLLDQDVLYRQYAYSSNPLVIVMEDKVQMAADRRKLIEQVESFTKEQLRRREAELEALREQNKITVEKYHELLGKLNNDYDQNEQLVKDMVEQYNKIDFDQLDERNRRISDCIINGRLKEADSLLRTKGDINKRIEQLNKHHAANEQARAILTQSEAAEDHERQDIAQDCYNKFQMFKMQHIYDSASRYIETRAQLNPTQFEWLISAGDFFVDYMADYDKAHYYYTIAMNKFGDTLSALEKAQSYNNIGVILIQKGNIDSALIILSKARDIINKGENSKNEIAANILESIGTAFVHLGEIDTAFILFNDALGIRNTIDYNQKSLCNSYLNIGYLYHVKGDIVNAESFYKSAEKIAIEIGNDSPEIASVYNNLGALYEMKGDYGKSILYNKKALPIMEINHGANHPYVAVAYGNAAGGLSYNGDYDGAIAYYKHSLSILLKVYGSYHETIATTLSNIGLTYYEKKELDTAFLYYKRALSNIMNANPDNKRSITNILDNMASVYKSKEQIDSAIVYYTKSMEIKKQAYGDNHLELAYSYRALGILLIKKQQLDSALALFNKAQKIRKGILGENNIHVITIYYDIATTYYLKGDYDSALYYFKKCLAGYETAYGLTHHKVGELYYNIGFSYSRLGNSDFAKEYLERALKVYENNYEQNIERIKATQEALKLLFDN